MAKFGIFFIFWLIFDYLYNESGSCPNHASRGHTVSRQGPIAHMAPFLRVLTSRENRLYLVVDLLNMSKSICSEVSLENPYFKLKIGTINKKKPTTFYVEGGTFITPVDEDLSFKDKMNNVYKAMSQGIMRLTAETKNVQNSFIANIDVADERMKVGKKTYFTFQYYLHQDGEPVSFSEITENGEKYTKVVLEKLEYSLKENGFAISKTKK